MKTSSLPPTVWKAAILLSLLSNSVTLTYSQVFTQKIAPDKAKEHGIKRTKSLLTLPLLQLPSIDLKKAFKEDSLDDLKGLPKRFGIDIDTDIDVVAKGIKYLDIISLI